MAKSPSLGKLHRYYPRWWHQAEPNSVTVENFKTEANASTDQQNESRFEKLADIALHPKRKKGEEAA